MPDYLWVPKTTALTNIGYYQDGAVAFSSLGDNWKIAYNASSAYSIKMGVVRSGGNVTFVFASSAAISLGDIDIKMVSPSLTTSFWLTGIVNDIIGGVGYYAVSELTLLSQTFPVTVFDTIEDCLSALSYGEITSGFSVYVTASPSYAPPTTNGINVYVTARMSDPNQQGGTSGTGGGQGTFNDSSDQIPVSPLPSISAAQSGLVTLFKPSLTELRDLGSYLWTNLTDFIENLNKIFVNPMDYLIALNIVPCNPSTGTRRAIKIGSFTTYIEMAPVESQWYEFDCGYVNIPEYWGSALDYSPYTKISLFLPFIGSVHLNTDEVMNKRIGVKYRVDLLSGQCVAMVTVASLVDQTDSVYYQYTGECSVSVPLTGSDWSRVYSAAIGAVGTAITGGIAAGAAGAAAGGATSALAGATAADAASNAGLAYSMINDTSKGIRGVQEMRDNMIRASQMALQAGNDAASAPARVANGVRATRIANTVNNTVAGVISGKAAIQHSGTISASAGMLGVKVPYLMIEYPNQSLAENYNHYCGYPSNITEQLGSLSGYTEIEQVIASGFGAITDSEMGELLEIMKGGFYL